MAESDSDEKNRSLDAIKAFDLVTEGLMSLDAHHRTSDKFRLSDARRLLNEAVQNVSDDHPLSLRAKYFLAMVEYLDGSKDTAGSFDSLNPQITYEPDCDWSAWSAYDAEVSYNAGAAHYSQGDYKISALRFQAARRADAAAPEVRLLAGAGAALSLSKLATELQKQEDVWNLVERVQALYREIRKELLINFLRRLWGMPHVEPALSRKARKLIEEAKEEVSRISPPRPQTPVVTTEPPTSQSGGLAGAT